MWALMKNKIKNETQHRQVSSYTWVMFLETAKQTETAQIIHKIPIYNSAFPRG